MKIKLFFFVFVPAMLFVFPCLSHAQSIGVGVGVAGVENFDFPEINWGIMLNIPISNKVDCNISFNKWLGDDSNFKSMINLNSIDDGLYFGNTGLDLLIYYNFFTRQKFSTSAGAGMGRYEMNQLSVFNNVKSFYQSTFILSSISKYNLTSHLTFFGKIDVCFDEYITGPNWGFATIGFELSPF